jgi:hypothetical protein
VSTASTTQQVTPGPADELDHGRGARIGAGFGVGFIGLFYAARAPRNSE